MWLIVAVIVLSVLLHLLVVKPHSYWKKKGIPYVTPLPFFGNVWSNVSRKKSFAYLLEDFYSQYSDKRYVGMYQFLQPVLIIRDLELIKKITVKEFDTFPEHRAFGGNGVDPLWEKNLFAMKGGQEWHDMRSTLSPSFTSSKMRIMYGLMKECAQQFSQHFEKKGGTVTIELKDAFTRFTNDVIATTAFGVSCDSLEQPKNEFYVMGKEATDFSGIKGLKFFVSTISPRLMKLFKIGIFSKSVSTFFRNLIKETLQVREEKSIVRPDMINLLMEARKGRLRQENQKVVDAGFAVTQEAVVSSPSKRLKSELSDDDITAQALIFFFAGFDTASTFMCFAAYELALNVDVQEKLYHEIFQAEKDNNGDISYETLLGMKYLDMVVTETLRKWPPTIALDRISVKPFSIEPEVPGETPVELEVGTNCWIPVYSIHRDPKYYPNPEKFDPERFSDENKHNIHPFTYLPFGSGPRNCIGSRFALLECKLILVEILRKFEIVPVVKTPIPLVLTPNNFVPGPEGGFWLGFKPRNKRI